MSYFSSIQQIEILTRIKADSVEALANSLVIQKLVSVSLF